MSIALLDHRLPPIVKGGLYQQRLSRWQEEEEE